MENLGLNLVIRELGIQRDFVDERIMIQKKIYLLEKIGLDLGLHFVWCPNGPFSDEISDFLNENLKGILTDRQNSSFSEFQLTEQAKEKISRVNGLSKIPEDVGLTKAEWFVLLASVSYISANPESWKIKKDLDIFDNLQKQIPWFSFYQFELALNFLKEKNFI